MTSLFLIFLFVSLVVLAVIITGYLLARRTARRLMQRAATPAAVARSLNEARYYARQIIRTVEQQPPGPLKDRLSLTLQPVRQWSAQLDKLEEGLSQLYSQRNLRREIRQTMAELEQLRRRLLDATGTEAEYLRQLKQSKKQHLSVLYELQEFQTRAELKIRTIASDLGATHAEVLLVISRGDFNERRLNRLDESLQEHLHSMRDILSAMDEVRYRKAAG